MAQHKNTRGVRIGKAQHEALKALSAQYHVPIRALMETAVNMLLTAHNQAGVTALFTETSKSNEPNRNTDSQTRVDEPGR